MYQKPDSILQFGFPNTGLVPPFTQKVYGDGTLSSGFVDVGHGSQWRIDSPFVSQLNMNPHVIISSNTISGMIMESSNVSTLSDFEGKDYIAKLAVGSNTFQNIIYQSDLDVWQPMVSGLRPYLQSFDIALRFPGANPVLDQHGANWSFTLYFKNDPDHQGSFIQK